MPAYSKPIEVLQCVCGGVATEVVYDTRGRYSRYACAPCGQATVEALNHAEQARAQAQHLQEVPHDRTP